MRLDDIDDVDGYLGKVVSDLGFEPWEREDAVAVGRDQLAKWFMALQPGDSLRRVAAGMIGKRIISGMRKERRHRSRVESLDALEAEPDEDYVSGFRAVATYGPDLDDQIDSANTLAAFKSADDLRDTRKVGRLMGGVPSHRPVPAMRAGEVDEARRQELRELGRFEYLKKL